MRTPILLQYFILNLKPNYRQILNTRRHTLLCGDLRCARWDLWDLRTSRWEAVRSLRSPLRWDLVREWDLASLTRERWDLGDLRSPRCAHISEMRSQLRDEISSWWREEISSQWWDLFSEMWNTTARTQSVQCSTNMNKLITQLLTKEMNKSILVILLL